MQKQASFKIKGMQRDASASAFNSEFAYDNKNIRIMPTDDSTLLSIVNERGTKLADIPGIGDYIIGTPIGQAVVDDELVIFSAGDDDYKSANNITPDISEVSNITPAQILNADINAAFEDNIYKIWFKESARTGNKILAGKRLFNGDLNFSYKNPIETLSFYENSDIKKVYWTDRRNQPRVINVADTVDTTKWNNNSFEFIPKLGLEEKVTITRDIVSNGIFSPGIIQYAFSYFNKYGQESNIFYCSPLYYVSYDDRGASPEDKVGNSFSITIENVDSSFDYIRVYSIHRTSIDAEPTAKRVVDLACPEDEIIEERTTYTREVAPEDVLLRETVGGATVRLSSLTPTITEDTKTTWNIAPYTYTSIKFSGEKDYLDTSKTDGAILIKQEDSKIIIECHGRTTMTLYSFGNNKVFYTDNGTTGDTIDPTELLYIGGEEVIFGTMTQKDNTLFLGDITLKRRLLDSTIRDYFKGKAPTFASTKSVDSPIPAGYYPYENQLKSNSLNFKTFKYLETYRLGVQFQHYTGKWSEPIWINDIRNTSHVEASYIGQSKVKLPEASYILDDEDVIRDLVSQGYIRVRPVIVYPTLSDRECICQGVLCPTVYNVEDRFGNSPFAQSSWFIRPNAPYDIYRTYHVNSKITFTLATSSSSIQVGDILETNSIQLNVTAISETTLNCTRVDVTKEIPLPETGTLTGVSSTGAYSIKYTARTEEWTFDWHDLDDDTIDVSKNSRAGVLLNNYAEVTVLKTGDQDEYTVDMDVVNSGAWAEFRHNYPIPGNNKRNAEIQCIYYTSPPYVDKSNTDSDTAEWAANNREYFYVDQSIVTLHSPDIEFDDNIKNLDTTGLKLRIVGYVPLTSFVGEIDIQTSTPPNNYRKDTEVAPGFYKEPVSTENISRFGFRGLMSGGFWLDEFSDYKAEGTNKEKLTTDFVVYPWHRNGSLNNTKYATDGYKSALLDKKKISNLKYSFNSYYFDTAHIWNAYVAEDSLKTGISGVSIFDSNEVTLARIPSPNNSGLPDINYYGNIDKVVTMSRFGWAWEYNWDRGRNIGYNKEDGYPIERTGTLNIEYKPGETTDGSTGNKIHEIFRGNYIGVYDKAIESKSTRGTDPVRIKYKSTPHAVMALNYSNSKSIRILPTLKDSNTRIVLSDNWDINNCSRTLDTQKPFWVKNNTPTGVSQDVLNIAIPKNINGSETRIGPEYGWLWIGELYNDNVQNRFGGQTEEAFENNLWLPCGESALLISNEGIADEVKIKWSEGDTYYQRYDHLKTYPFTLEDQNAITEIVSFMCETRINLDGRYDKNRGQTNNLAVTPTNFNLMNDAYSQQNNFFTYRAINPNKLNLDNFHNTITWTKTKTAGELVDTWTNITLASTLDLDGDKGFIRSLKRFNNNLIAFQDKGISQILYNENMQISSTEGVPIEIANSGKVNGKRYLSEQVGCTNKWSICETPKGIYFIDDITKGIFLFNGELGNLSDNLGFHSWINKKSDSVNIWNPVDFNGFATYYDKVNGDVFFISKDECLAFSEPLSQFTSFYSYEGVPYFANIKDLGLMFRKKDNGEVYRPWWYNEGEYNMFFDKYQPFYTTVIANPDMQLDKIFSNIEFRADSWEGDTLLNTTFDTLTVWNEYQRGESKLNNVIGKPSTLKKKFRVWRANIPRANSNGRDRMRNPWLYLKLSMEKENTNKTLLHDIVVDYFV